MKRTYRFDPKLGKLVEVTPPSRNGQLSLLQNDRHYSDKPFVAHDGTVINSRKKHQAYMKRNGWTTADDYTKKWEKDAERRASYFTGVNNPDRRERAETIARAMEQHRGR